MTWHEESLARPMQEKLTPYSSHHLASWECDPWFQSPSRTFILNQFSQERLVNRKDRQRKSSRAWKSVHNTASRADSPELTVCRDDFGKLLCDRALTV